ncbi:MAG: filamentous hemagglutinin N-terminal domain-containing protein, partial [Pseudomonas sp.]
MALAEIVVDPVPSNATNVIAAPNGVPVIEIANPNNNGLSHNRFNQFDVVKPGVVFNNSLANGQSQLGGALLRNPNLSRSARAILTEVTGNKPSSLAGTLEVFGDKADLLIANPNGLTVNGVTTLNTSSLTLSTGQVRNADSGLQLLVDQHSGQVLIGADGVNTEGLSYFDIVARTVALQGAIGSQARETDLQIAAGQGRYDPATRSFTGQAGAQGNGLAISGSAAGAMHGRFINLISSDSGAGVRHEGLILAARDIAISADGDIELTDTAAAGQVQVASTANLVNSGTLEAGKALGISARNMVNQQGGYLGAGTDLQIDASTLLTNAGAVQAAQALTFNGQYLKNAGLLRGNTLAVTAAQVDNQAGATIYADDTARLRVSGNFNNQRGAGLYAQNDLTLDVGGAVLNNAATLAAGKALHVQAGTSLTNTTGGMLAGGTVGLQAATISNRDQAKIHGNDIALSAQQSFSSDNQASIQASHNLALDTQAFSLAGSEILAGNDLSLSVGRYQNSGTLTSFNTASLSLKNNADLLIDAAFKAPQAANLFTLSAHDITVTSELNSPSSVQINASGNVRNQGALIVGKSLGITAKGLIENQAGKLIWAGEDMYLNAGTQLLNGRDAVLLAVGDINLSAGQKVQNNVGRIEAQGDIAIDTPLLENLSETSGGLRSNGQVKENTWYAQSDGLIEKDYWNTKITLPLYASTLTVKPGVIKAGGDLLLNQDSGQTGGIVRNIGGLMAASDNVLIHGDLENRGVSVSKNLLDLLEETQVYAQWSTSSIWTNDGEPIYDSLYGFLEHALVANRLESEWVSSLKLVKTPEVNQLLSAVLGADWKNLSQEELFPRWAAFKQANKTQDYYADKPAEISAGGALLHSGGRFDNGTGKGGTVAEQRRVDVQVGDEHIDTLDGELEAQFNLNKSADALREQLNSPLFQKRPVTADSTVFARIKPLYETRIQYIDQSQFLGSEYFLDKIGYDSAKSVTVLGDAYFDHQLIVQSVEQRVGHFFAQTQRLSDTALVQRLLDNGARLTSEAGFTLGQPLTAAQIAGLQTDVVWYENQLVDGQLVLAPRLYLSEKTLAARDRDTRGSALVTANTVLIDATAVNNINATVRGNTDTFIYAKNDLNNVSVGGVQAGLFGGDSGQLVVAAEGKVRNQGGTLSGYQTTVVGGAGVSSSATTGYDENGFLVVRDNGFMGAALTADAAKAEEPKTDESDAKSVSEPTEAAAQKPLTVERPDVRAIFEERLNAGPVDTSQGSSLSVLAGGDINLTAAATQADTVSLQTTGNLNFKDVHEVRSA